MITKDLKSTKGITLISLIVTIVVLLILAGISLSVLRGENGILVQTKSARIKTELSKFMEEGGFAYSELYAERVNNPEVVILESDIIAKLISNYGYEGRITEITDGVPTNITVGNIIEDVVANGEKVIVGVQKGGGNSTYYVELLGKYYPIHFNNLEISIKEEEGQEQAGRIDNTEFTAVSDKEEVVIATAKNTNGVLTIELQGMSRGTANITVTYGTAESKTVEVNVKGKTTITVEAEKDSSGIEKGTITSPIQLTKEYVDGELITLTAEGIGDYSLEGWYIDETKLTLNDKNKYIVSNNFIEPVTIVAKFVEKGIFVSFESNTGTLKFYDHSGNDTEDEVWYKDSVGNPINIKEITNFYSNTPWESNRNQIHTVIIENKIMPNTTTYLFRDMTNLIEIKQIENLDTSNVTNMDGMFKGCNNLASLDVSGFDTSNVVSMYMMFGGLNSEGCNSLNELDVSSFDTSKVTSMAYMFNGCKLLENIDVSNFDTSNVTDMSFMFRYCSSLTSLNVDNFNTANVTSMFCMFDGCSSLTALDLKEFDTGKVGSMMSMFCGCSKLETIDLRGLDTSNVSSFMQMFHGCKKLKDIYFSSDIDTSNVWTMSRMFYGCNLLTNLDVSKFDTSKVRDMSEMFCGCSSITSLNLSTFNTSNVTNMSYMFSNCSSITSLNLSNFTTSKPTDMSFMFYNCKELTSLILNNFNTSYVTNMGAMFRECSSLTTLNLGSFNTQNVTSMGSMFYGCSSLTTLDLGSFNTQSVASMGYMFLGCYNLTTIYASTAFVTTDGTSSYNMFSNCWKLKGGNGTKYDSSVIDKTYARIDKKNQKGYFTQK